MTRSARAVRPAPNSPLRNGSSLTIEEAGVRSWGVFSFPPSNRLIITTTKGVYRWDIYGITEIFRSGSEGIVAAKQVAGSSEMLAVADNQVVVLHDINRGMQKSYRLRGSEGRVRLLKYAKEPKNLYFTTTLHNSVQSYSLKNSKLLNPSHTHPSPPSVFALSCNSRFLLSTSTTPPTIYLASLVSNTSPVLLRPQCSSSAVVAADFHPERENYFTLAFADGTTAVLDAMHFFYRHGKGERRDDAAGPATGAELAFIRGLHVGTIKTVATDSGVTLEGYEPGMDVGGVELKGSGITAVAFVPGRKATVVTVGADGRCCVVDFTQPSKHKAVLLKSWHIRRPATSVSIICSAHRASPTQLDGADDMAPAKTNNPPNGAYYVAVGRADGRVLLFDLDGKPLGEQALDEDGARVIDVEWTQVTNDASIPQKNNRSGIRRSPAAKLRRKSLESSVLSHGRPSQLRVMAEPAEDPLFDFSTPRKALGAFPWEPPSNESTVAALESPQTVESAPASSDTGITSKDSNEKPHHISQTSSYTTPRRQTGGYQVVESATISSEFLPDDVSSERLPPPLPPRPTPKPGGRLSVRRAQTADQTALNNASYLSISAKARRVSAGNPRLSKGVAIANRPTKSQVLFGPRKAPNPVTDTFKSHSGSSNIQVSSEQPEDAWFDISPEPPRLQAETSPQSSDATTKSFKTASSHLDTSSSPDRSDDTVVDWSAGLSQQVPTLHVTHPSGERPFNQKPKKKGHISLSVSSASDLTFTPSFSNPDDTKHPVIPSPAGSPRRHLPSLPSIRPNEDMSPLKTQSKQKGHVGLSEFSDTNKTVTPLSSGSDGPIVQWPSLKKSPRIPELNKGIPNPVKYAPPSSPPVKESMEESVTGLILEGYIAAPSPPKPPKPAPKPIVEPGSKSSSCTCSETMEATLNDSLGDLRAEIKRQFEAQKIWLEDLMKGEEESRMILVEENRWLRDELARIEKEKCQGKRKGPSGM